ncbi:histidine kinase [Mucilaginibacter rigui]|uniref:Histidine kinase n=1 Tax=Mucilaginibacter rigui TaxID=534635 RepID=A0ABR7X9F0_9SPHI|nr:histidine kinase [Mucilaginibacter rigui]MBD1387199.1 histidine kinase [Mucilaginibacter rigui]
MNAASFKPGDLHIPRVLQHIIFWVLVMLALTVIYSVQVSMAVSFRNNLFYAPVQIAYYYVIAYWVVPAYLFKGKYIKFIVLSVVVAVVSMLLSRSSGLIFVIPYMIKTQHITDPDYLSINNRPFFQSLFNTVGLVNAFKGTNLIIGFVLAVKLFKMWYERKQAALEAELGALKAQVHPHFLFNTLNNLYALSLNNSPKSPELILGLSGILRYMLYECSTDEVPLEKEVFMMQQYVNLEKLRYEDRIDINFNISGNLKNKQIAPLIILPFIENAFKHGASETTGQVWVNVDIAVRDNWVKLKVANNNPPKNTPGDMGAGIGLSNVIKRLNLLYPGTHYLKIMDEEDTFLIVLDVEMSPVVQPAKQAQLSKQLVPA